MLDPAAPNAVVTRALYDLADLIHGYRDPGAEDGEQRGGQPGGPPAEEGEVLRSGS